MRLLDFAFIPLEYACLRYPFTTVGAALPLLLPLFTSVPDDLALLGAVPGGIIGHVIDGLRYDRRRQ